MRKLSAAIRRLSKTVVTVTRTASPTLDHGRKIAGAKTTLDIRCSVQPLSDKELLNLPEGQRTKSKFKLFTDTTLKVIDDPDELTYEGIEYVVQGTTDWIGTTDFGRYLLVKKLLAAI